MGNISLDDTIVAISTAIGQAGIGIVRMSGRDSLRIADRIFMSKDGNKPSVFKTYTTHYGYIADENKETIDEVILTVMRAPKSYTKEDIVEINCHSGIVPLKKILDLTVRLGARIAQPGEFTKRAFLNGRIDLSQAEAVLDIVAAKTDLSLKVAFRQLEGEFGKRVKALKEELLSIYAHLEALIDFPEEDIEILRDKEIMERLEKISMEIKSLLDSTETGKVLRDGIKTVICGSPNVGKSSLLNALLKEERAIVTPIPGTTRDTIEEALNIKGIPVNIIDTAGIAKPKDYIESCGVERSQKAIIEADLVLFVIDGSRELIKEDLKIIENIKEKTIIIVKNKIDLEQKTSEKELKTLLPEKAIVKTCAITSEGIGDLEDTISSLIWKGRLNQSLDEVILSNARHISLIKEVYKEIKEATLSIKKCLPLEIIAVSLRSAADYLSKITGDKISEALLDRIFSEFCIGK